MVFNGEKLKWFYDDGRHRKSIPAYSGNPGAGRNDQGRKNFGPIPEGTYWINPQDDEYRTNFNFLAAKFGRAYVDVTGAWGNRRIKLRPDSATDSLGRSKFYLHGGRWKGSAGCIDIGPNDIPWIDRIGKLPKLVKVTVNYRGWTGRVPAGKNGDRLEW